MANCSKPPWLRKKCTPMEEDRVREILRDIDLHTVCEQACCPNMGECFSRGTATFLILGKTCTRSCRYCAVQHGIPLPPDEREHWKVTLAAKQMGLRYVVLTSVTRDDLPDGGASHFSRTIRTIRLLDEGIQVEVLIPDFKGEVGPLAEVLMARPTVLNHNVETVPRLFPKVRPQADFGRSIELLRISRAINPLVPVKSGFMLGLGETEHEVLELLHSLREAGCDFVTIGQYLRPRPDLFPVARYVEPDEFEEYRHRGLEMGFRAVASGPFVRSSYNAMELLETSRVECRD